MATITVPQEGRCWECGQPLPGDGFWGSLGLPSGCRFCSRDCFESYEPAWNASWFPA